MQEYTGEVEVITNIGTTPDERGLTTPQFKAKFDEGLKNFVAWFNDTHKTEFEAVQTGLASHMADLTYQELSSYATDIDDNGAYKTVTWKRNDNTTYAISSLIGTAQYTQVKIDYYDNLGTEIVKTITWNLVYDDNEFIYNKVVV